MSPPNDAGVEPRDVTVLIRGVGDIGSAVAHLLFSNGYSVIVHEEPQPTTTRRGMAFADAVFEGHERCADRQLLARGQDLAVRNRVRPPMRPAGEARTRVAQLGLVADPAQS